MAQESQKRLSSGQMWLQVSGRVLFPAAGMLEVAWAAGACLSPHEQSSTVLLGDVLIPSPLVLPAEVQTASKILRDLSIRHIGTSDVQHLGTWLTV